MTREEIFNEIKNCELQIKRLNKEAEAEEDFNKRLALYDEADELLYRMFELNALHKEALLTYLMERLTY